MPGQGGADTLGSGSAVRARPGLSAGDRPGLFREKPSRLCLHLILLAVGSGGQRGRGAAPRGGGGAGCPEARAETAQIPGAAPKTGEYSRRPPEISHLYRPVRVCGATRRSLRQMEAFPLN